MQDLDYEETKYETCKVVYNCHCLVFSGLSAPPMPSFLSKGRFEASDLIVRTKCEEKRHFDRVLTPKVLTTVVDCR